MGAQKAQNQTGGSFEKVQYMSQRGYVVSDTE